MSVSAICGIRVGIIMSVSAIFSVSVMVVVSSVSVALSA